MEKPNNRQIRAVPPSAKQISDKGEGPLQAYIRHIHEARTVPNDNDEPVRSKDPWLGVGS